jgi:hypothetical protein
MNGKGDRPRPVDLEKYAANYDAIFKKPTPPAKKVNRTSRPGDSIQLFNKTK